MKRRRWWVAGLAIGILLFSSVSVNRATHSRLVDGAGRPIQGAFVFYYYSAGTRSIWPWIHQEGPFLTRTDGDGRLYVPWRAHLRFPLVTLTSPVRAYITVYVPTLHNACRLFDPDAIDSHCAMALSQSGERSFEVFDLAARPVERFHSLWLLVYGPQTLTQEPTAQRRELIAAERKEFSQFLAEYGNEVFENSYNAWGHIETRDWTKEGSENRPWSFFLQRVPFYGIAMEEKLSRMERQSR